MAFGDSAMSSVNSYKNYIQMRLCFQTLVRIRGGGTAVPSAQLRSVFSCLHVSKWSQFSSSFNATCVVFLGMSVVCPVCSVDVVNSKRVRVTTNLCDWHCRMSTWQRNIPNQQLWTVLAISRKTRRKGRIPIKGCAIAQVASRRLLTAEDWVSPRIGYVRFGAGADA
jgi:hypothetical protein